MEGQLHPDQAAQGRERGQPLFPCCAEGISSGMCPLVANSCLKECPCVRSSYFIVLLSPKVWRLRKYPTEKCVAAAKPLWFLPENLSLLAGGCKRVV